MMSKAMIDVDEIIRRQQRSAVQSLCCGEVFGEEVALGPRLLSNQAVVCKGQKRWTWTVDVSSKKATLCDKILNNFGGITICHNLLCNFNNHSQGPMNAGGQCL